MSADGLPPDVAFDRRAVHLGGPDALVIADVHVGRTERSNVEFPLGERADLLDRLEGLLERFGPARVVVAGDLLHAFDSLPSSVVETVEAVEAAVAAAGADLAVVAGNHDTMLAELLDGPLDGGLRLGDGTLVVHGHEPPDGEAARYVIGHDHPAITIEGVRHPCFLFGESAYRGGDVLALPAFDRLARGSVVDGMTGADFMSPVLGAGVGGYRPVVYDPDRGEPLSFPPLAKLREHL